MDRSSVLAPPLPIWVTPDKSRDQSSYHKLSTCYVLGSALGMRILLFVRVTAMCYHGHSIQARPAMPAGQPPQNAASQPSPLLAPGHQRVLQERGKAGPLLLPTAQWGHQLGPWKQGAKPFQATCGAIQGSQTFHTEASPLGVSLTQPPQEDGNLLGRRCPAQLRKPP